MTDISGMSDDEDSLRRKVRDALVALDTDPTTLSLRLEKGKDYIRDLLKGRKKSMDAISLARLDRELDRLRQSPTAPSTDVKAVPADTIRRFSSADFLGERDFPVYSAVEGGPGEMVVSTDPIDRVPRPWVMNEVRDGYAVLVVGESMEPAFEPGDMAIINPRLPHVRNKDYIFVQGDDDNGEFRATIKRLVRHDANVWVVCQFNEPREFTLEKRLWPRALRVMGKLSNG